MKDIIHFRSRFASERGSGDSKKEKKNRTPESSGVQVYAPGDDAREISWKHSARGGDIYVRNRVGSTEIPILIGVGYHALDSLPGKGGYREKRYMIEKMVSSLKESAIFHRYPHEERISTNIHIVRDILERKPKNTLIILITGSIELDTYARLDSLASLNDLLVITTLSPYETHPEGLLFESQQIGTSYTRALDDRLLDIRKKVHTSGGSHLVYSSEDNFILFLNHFFRERYGR